MKELSKRAAQISIALVDGDARVRHARQLMLRAGGNEVRAYPTRSAALADPVALASDCIVADLMTGEFSGIQLLSTMRAGGWRGVGILLADGASPVLHLKAIEEGFVLMRSADLDDRRLAAAITTAAARHAADFT